MGQEKEYKTIEEVLEKANSASGKTFSYYDVNGRLNRSGNKGGLGQVIEEGLFGYNVNSRKGADFSNLGLELKVTGVWQVAKKKKKEFVAKERLVLNVINYEEEANASFKTSSFWNKNNKLLLLFYVYDKTKEAKDFTILKPILYEFSNSDLAVIEKDWDFIHQMIKGGKARELNESETSYLAACTKGSTAAKSYRDQYGTELQAKQRAYSLKKSFLDKIIRDRYLNEEFESITKNFSTDLSKMTISDVIINIMKPFIGKDTNELFNTYHVNSKAKSKYSNLTSRIFGLSKDLENADEISKAGIIIKNIVVDEKMRLKESISFPKFTFVNLVNTDFEESDFYNTFYSHSFIFLVFQKRGNKVYFYKTVKWNASNEIIETNARKVYEKTKEVLLSGNIVNSISFDSKGNKKVNNNFPKMSQDIYFHVRPHGRDSKDTDLLPKADNKTGIKSFTKQGFWLNASFVAKLLK